MGCLIEATHFTKRLFSGTRIILLSSQRVGNILNSAARPIFCIWAIMIMMGVKISSIHMTIANQRLTCIHPKSLTPSNCMIINPAMTQLTPLPLTRISFKRVVSIVLMPVLRKRITIIGFVAKLVKYSMAMT